MEKWTIDTPEYKDIVEHIICNYGKLFNKMKNEIEILTSQRDFYKSQVDKMNNKYYKNITNSRKI